MGNKRNIFFCVLTLLIALFILPITSRAAVKPGNNINQSDGGLGSENTKITTYYCGYMGYYYDYLLICEGITGDSCVLREREGDMNKELPDFDDESWYSSEKTFSVAGFNTYAEHNIFCPPYGKENEDGSLTFSADINGYNMLWKKEKIVETSGEMKPNDSNYYQKFKAKEACTTVKDTKWDKVCKYNGQNDITFFVYLKNDQMFIAPKGWAFENGLVETRFTFNQLSNILSTHSGCPLTMYYWLDSILYVALEDSPDPLYVRYPAELQSENEKLVLPDYCFEPGNLELETNNCEGILGRPEDTGSVAYYLQMVFNVMKYIAIMLLIGLTIMDFVGAVTSHDDDQLKKATSKAVTRLIICIILFVLPTIIEFLMKVLDIYGDAGGCKIR